MQHFTFGAERECFTVKDGLVVPVVKQILKQFAQGKHGFNSDQFCAELFAGQLEMRTTVSHSISQLLDQVTRLSALATQLATDLGCQIWHREYVSERQLGELLPNPLDQRHQSIWNTFSRDKQIAASQVASFQIHVGMTKKQAVRVFQYANQTVVDALIGLGDNSERKRLNACHLVIGKSCMHPSFNSVREMIRHTYRNNNNPKNNWDWIRWKPTTQTLEFRMFGNHEDISVLEKYCEAVQYIVRQAISGTVLKSTG